MAKRKETPAQRVYDAFGGAMEVVRATGLSNGEVYRWGYPKSKRGCDGRIPHQHQALILTAAKQLKVKLKPEDLVDTP